MDYIGSKEKINKWMFGKMFKNFNNTEGVSFLDACAGSGSVSKYAAALKCNVVSNDILDFSRHIVIGSTLIGDKIQEALGYIKIMNDLDGVDGFFFQNYSEESGRLYFSNENAKKLDACRQYIDTISDDVIRSYLLYCLLEAMSRVSNTASVQAAFLKKLKHRANQKLIIKRESVINNKNVMAYSSDISTLLNSKELRLKFKEDILYIDPPYNSRQYGPNYHLYETLVKYDNPKLKDGKTGLRDWSESKSNFCSKKTCLEFLKNIIDSSTAKYIFMSYNSDGLISRDDIENFILTNYNNINISVHILKQKRFKSDSNNERNYNNSLLKEFLFEFERIL